MRRFFCMLLSLAVLFAAGTVYAENNETRGHHVWGSEFGEEGYLPPEAEKILEECGLSVLDSEMVFGFAPSSSGVCFSMDGDLHLDYADKNVSFYWFADNETLVRHYAELYARKTELEEYLGELYFRGYDRKHNPIFPADVVSVFEAYSKVEVPYINFDDLIRDYNSYAQGYYDGMSEDFGNIPLVLVTEENMEKSSEDGFDVIRCHYDWGIELTFYLVKDTRSVDRIEMSYRETTEYGDLLDLIFIGYDTGLLVAIGNDDPLLMERVIMDENSWLSEGKHGAKYYFHVEYEDDPSTPGEALRIIYSTYH